MIIVAGMFAVCLTVPLGIPTVAAFIAPAVAVPGPV